MSNLGQNGRFGNQLFQYAFLRTQAGKLNTGFFVPPWLGDSTFELQEESARLREPENKLETYTEPYESYGFNAIELRDNVDVSGHFQSQRMFDASLIRRIFSFRPEIALNARLLLGADFNPSRDIAVGIRLTDFEDLVTHYVPRVSYYRNAIEKLQPARICLFSDDPRRAEALLRRAGYEKPIRTIEAPTAIKLAAMAEFARFIIGPSTFHWWGAWLSVRPEKRVVVPQEGATRPGAPIRAFDYWPAEWEPLRALHWGDGYKFRRIKTPFLRVWRKLSR